MLRFWYGTGTPPRRQQSVDPSVRRASFTEVVGGLTADDALIEARRCLSCGNCFECDGCYSACPERAVVKLGPGNRYRFDLDRCTGCGICADQCPCAAIVMMDLPAEGGSHRSAESWL